VVVGAGRTSPTSESGGGSYLQWGKVGMVKEERR
jgi:hypothetical protein